jgi:hypothetical protein
MQEAWFLFDENAIRRAAGNPNGRTRLDLPALKNTEKAADPKSMLNQALKDASELTGRRLQKFDVNAAAHRVADLISDFSPLFALSAFAAYDALVALALKE